MLRNPLHPWGESSGSHRHPPPIRSRPKIATRYSGPIRQAKQHWRHRLANWYSRKTHPRSARLRFLRPQLHRLKSRHHRLAPLPMTILHPFSTRSRAFLRHRWRNRTQTHCKYDRHRTLKCAAPQVVGLFHRPSYQAIAYPFVLLSPHISKICCATFLQPPLRLCARFMCSAILCSVFVLHFRNPNKRENSHGTYP